MLANTMGNEAKVACTCAMPHGPLVGKYSGGSRLAVMW